MGWKGKAESVEFKQLKSRLENYKNAVEFQQKQMDKFEEQFDAVVKSFASHAESFQNLYPESNEDDLKSFVHSTTEEARAASCAITEAKGRTDSSAYSRIKGEWRKCLLHYPAVEKLYTSVDKAHHAQDKAKHAYEKISKASKKDPREEEKLQLEYNQQRTQYEHEVEMCLKEMYDLQAKSKAVLRAGFIAIYLCRSELVELVTMILSRPISYGLDNKDTFAKLKLEGLTEATSPKPKIPASGIDNLLSPGPAKESKEKTVTSPRAVNALAEKYLRAAEKAIADLNEGAVH